jgi:hypothetical protein
LECIFREIFPSWFTLLIETWGWFCGQAITATSLLSRKLNTAVFIWMNSRKNQIGGVALSKFKMILIAALLAMSTVAASNPVPVPPGTPPPVQICRPILCPDGQTLDIRTCTCRRMDI